MANLNNGYLQCDLCKGEYIISDSDICSIINDTKDVCINCFKSIANEGGWYRRIEQRICFEYKKVSIPHSLKWSIWERDNFTCKFCGTRENLSIDHVRPESKGGTLDIENLQTLCRSCNSKKNTK